MRSSLMDLTAKVWLLSSLFHLVVHGAVYKGTIKGADSWKYLARFCFLPSDTQTGTNVQGQLEAEFTFKYNAKVTLMEYLERSQEVVSAYGEDQVTSFEAWTEVYNSEYNCTTRMQKGMAFPLYDPELEFACKSVCMAGRDGTNQVLNGMWSPYEPVPTYGGRRVYAKPNGDGWLFIFFMGDAGAWYVAREVGSKLVVAEARSQAISPDRVTSSWFVADGEGGFEEDALMKATCLDDVVEGDRAASCSANPIYSPPPFPGTLSLSPPDETDFISSTKGQDEIVGYGLQPDENGYVTATRSQEFHDDEARWIFVALANCDLYCSADGYQLCQGSLDVEYKLTFTNGEGWSTKHFSADEQGIVVVVIVFFILQVGLVMCSLYVRKTLVKLNKFHHTVKLLGISVSITCIARFFDMIHWCKYADDGEGARGLHVAAMWFSGLAETALLLLVILVAKGWSICCRKISATGRTKIAVYTTVYLFTWTVLLIWYEHGMSDANVVYIYHCVPGYLIVTLRVAGVVWLGYATFVTLSKYKMKRRFFKKFLVLFSLWLISLPIIVLIALAIPTWTRYRVVTCLELIFTFIAQAALLVLYFPNRYNRSFPFHATTSDMMPRQPTRMIVGGGNNNGKHTPDDSNMDEDERKKQTFGNTAVIRGNALGAHGGRIERAALRSAMELSHRIKGDAVSLRGALEQMDTLYDDNEDEFENDEDGFHNIGGVDLWNRPMRNPSDARTSAGPSTMGASSAPSLRNQMANGSSANYAVPTRSGSMGSGSMAMEISGPSSSSAGAQERSMPKFSYSR